MSVLSFATLSLEDISPFTTLKQDPGDQFDTDLNDKEDRRNETSITDIYLQACKLVGVVPVSFFLRNLDSPTMSLSHHGLGPLGCKALAIALADDIHLTTLELADNYIQAEGAKHMAEMLKANFTIEHLDLSNNHLCSSGAEYVGKMLTDSFSLKSIKLSGNGFTDDDAKYFAEALCINSSIKELDLSHNRFCGRGGEHLGLLLANNEYLEVLNLCWNQLRMKGAVALSAGLKVNTMLKYLDLSWNGFGNEGALAMGEALKFNNTLVFLNLNNNRITNEGVSMLCRGLEYNDTLQVLMLAYNSLTVEGALSLVKTVKKTHNTALEMINICNVLVNEKFLHLLEVTCEEHPSLDVQYGGVGGVFAKKPIKRIDPMKVIQDYLDQRKLRLWDFFRNIDKDATMRVPVVDFRNAMQQSSIPLDRFQIEELIQRLDRDGTGIVDYRGLVDTRKQMVRNHRRQLRKDASRHKKEKHKSDRILRTFQNAVEAVTPIASVVISPGEIKAEWTGPRHFSATPHSSWHRIATSNIVSNPSNDQIHLPMLDGMTSHHFTKSPNFHSCSQPNFLTASPQSDHAIFLSARAICSNPEMSCNEVKELAVDHLTKSRPALETTPLGVKAKKVMKSKAKKFVEKTSKNSKVLTKFN
ncbi:uncharacterized protein lrrc74a [Stigmatopora nigra]